MPEPTKDNPQVTPAAHTGGSAQSKAKVWQHENAVAIAERRAWIESHGTPLADIQVLQSS